MLKVDLKKELEHLYHASAKQVQVVDVPSMRFLMIDGSGDPNTAPAYAEAVEALFSVSYTAKFAVKKSRGLDYGVLPLEGLWWADDLAAFAANDRAKWLWTMMIMQPHFVTADELETAVAEVRRKKALRGLDALRVEWFNEGKCAQLLHVGPFTDEGPTVERLHAFVDAHGARRGKHHEIYLSDVRRAAPAKWKTIIRQPLE